jgi:beta-N-acetylhexosaminidase
MPDLYPESLAAVNLRESPFFLDDEAIAWVEDTLDLMPEERKCGQLFCLSIKTGAQEELDRIFDTVEPGACMLRPMPAKSATAFVRKLQKRSPVPALVAANLEKGGNGVLEEGSYFASPMAIAATGDISFSEKLAQVCAAQSRYSGVNWAFAPVADIDFNFRNPITNTRTFGSDPERVKRMATAYIKTIQSLGFASSAKHFPGDGRDERDQHLVTSINDLDTEEWMNTYGSVYKACIDAGVMSIMVGHIMQPAWSRHFSPDIKDKDILPASLSRELMERLLRETLGFNGLICTDATTMAGFMLAMPRPDAIPLSIASGADMFMFARNLEEDVRFMMDGVRSGVISDKRLDMAVRRILAAKAALGLHKGSLEPDEERALSSCHSLEYRDWSEECADKSITLVKSEDGVLPLNPETRRRILFYPIEQTGGGTANYKVTPACDRFAELMAEEGFDLTVHEPQSGSEGYTEKYGDIANSYDAIIYMANIATRSNQTQVRIEWEEPMGSNCPHYKNTVPTIFISVENPYHLLDFPRARTFINCYASSESTLKELVKKLTGKSSFKGKSPIDPFCGKWDTRLY